LDIVKQQMHRLLVFVMLGCGATACRTSKEHVVLNYVNASAEPLLGVYVSLIGSNNIHLVVSSDVYRLPFKFTLQYAGSKADARRKIESALLEQGGVVFTRLGSNQVSVTLNDALHAVELRHTRSATPEELRALKFPDSISPRYGH
jgi:hypothetical protein